MSPDLPAPTGTAAPDLLALELAEPAPATRVTGAHARPRTAEVTGPVDPIAVDSDLPGSRGEHLLQCAFGSQERARRFYNDQVLDHLNQTMVEFVRRIDMAFIATSDASGECDSSLRAGPPGFIEVLDQRHVAYPEYRGNGVMASLGNISENPHVGILMVDFVRDLIGLHVNGMARIVDDADLRSVHPALRKEFERGRTPERWVVVEVQEAYIHCRKHIPRMQPVERTRDWGTDDMRRKGGDYFDAKVTSGLIRTASGAP